LLSPLGMFIILSVIGELTRNHYQVTLPFSLTTSLLDLSSHTFTSHTDSRDCATISSDLFILYIKYSSRFSLYCCLYYYFLEYLLISRYVQIMYIMYQHQCNFLSFSFSFPPLSLSSYVILFIAHTSYLYPFTHHRYTIAFVMLLYNFVFI
jgi:hypothetical protein